MPGRQAAPGGARLRRDPDRGGAGGLRVADVAVEHEARYWYPDDGSIVWIAGYTPVDPDTGRYLARDAPQLTERGLVVAGVAGAAHVQGDVLQSSELSPGARLILRRDPGNEHDPHAIAVLTLGGEQAGWVPREVAAQIAPALDTGLPWAAVVLRERRPSPRASRSGLTMLLAPAETIVLRERSSGEAGHRD